MKTVSTTLGALLLAASLSTHATPVSWTLKDVVFDDGSTASGSFVFDADAVYDIDPITGWTITGVVTAYHITTTGGGTLGANTYDAVASGYNYSAANHQNITFNTPAFPFVDRYLLLTALTPLTNSGGTVGLDTNYSYECENCVPLRYVSGGELVGTPLAVPEPAGYGMLLAGLGLVGWLQRRRQAA